MSTVDELREEWLAKVEVAEGLTDEARSHALIIARFLVDGQEPNPSRVATFRQVDSRAEHAWASARHAQAALDEARAQVPA